MQKMRVQLWAELFRLAHALRITQVRAWGMGQVRPFTYDRAGELRKAGKSKTANSRVPASLLALSALKY